MKIMTYTIALNQKSIYEFNSKIYKSLEILELSIKHYEKGLKNLNTIF